MRATLHLFLRVLASFSFHCDDELPSDILRRPFRAQQQRHLQDSDSCSLSIFAETLNFTSCQRLTTDSSDAQLLWTLQHREGANGTSIHAALTCHDRGWCAFGQPDPETGQSAGGSAIVLQGCSSCSSGASASNTYIQSWTADGLRPGAGRLAVTGLQAAKTGNLLAAAFTLRLPSDAPALGIMSASGPVSDSGAVLFTALGDASQGSLDLATGALRVTAAARDYTAGTVAHGALSVVAMAVLLPVSVAVAHCLRGWQRWFPVHRALGLLSTACMAVATALGVYHWRVELDIVTRVLLWHIIVGLAVMACLLNQAFAALLRPHPGTKLRPAWDVFHHSTGLAAIILGFVASYTGFEARRRQGRPVWWGFYAALPLVWVACAVAMLARPAVVDRPGAAAKRAYSV